MRFANRAFFAILLLAIAGAAIAQKKNNNIQDEFLIGVFWPPVWAHTNDTQYKKMREANIDVIQNVSSTDLYTAEKNKKMLDLAAKYDMKVLVADPRVHGTNADIQAMVQEFKDHPATFGYYIMDEPDTAKLNWCAQTLKIIKAEDPGKMGHVNLFPVYALGAQLGNIDYATAYVDRWIQMAGPEHITYLAFDHYPFAGDGHFRYSYYNNLDIIRKAGLKYNIKTSAYLQSMGIPGAFKRPSEAELRFNVYSMLAYGIKHPVWFTYWTPSGQGEKFLPSIIDAAGNPTDLYPWVQQLGKEMKQLGKTLINLDAKEVFHTGNSLPDAVLPLPAGALITPMDTAAFIVTSFVHKNNAAQYIMLVNKDYTKTQQVKLLINKTVGSVWELGKNAERQRRLKWKKDRIVAETFQPGEGKLYRVQ